MRIQKLDLTICACGCEQKIYLYDIRGRKRKYLAEHRGRWQIKLTRGEKISLKNKGKHYSISTEFKKGVIPFNKGLLGKDNPNWKEFKVTPLKMWIRHTQIYINWHNFILKRDDYTCQICKVKGGKLHVDHFQKTFAEIISQYNVKNFEEAFNISELFDVENGRTLCELCHRLTPTWGGKRKESGIYAR